MIAANLGLQWTEIVSLEVNHQVFKVGWEGAEVTAGCFV